MKISTSRSRQFCERIGDCVKKSTRGSNVLSLSMDATLRYPHRRDHRRRFEKRGRTDIRSKVRYWDLELNIGAPSINYILPHLPQAPTFFFVIPQARLVWLIYTAFLGCHLDFFFGLNTLVLDFKIWLKLWGVFLHSKCDLLKSIYDRPFF